MDYASWLRLARHIKISPALVILGEPDDDIDSDHMMVCPVCGVTFDMRDLGQVFDHMHDGPEMPITILPTKKPDDH